MIDNTANISKDKIPEMKLLPPADHLRKSKPLLFSTYLANTVPLPPGNV